MTAPITNISKDQWRVGRYLDICPDHISRYLDVIDRLLSIEEHKGRNKMMLEIAKMMGHP